MSCAGGCWRRASVSLRVLWRSAQNWFSGFRADFLLEFRADVGKRAVEAHSLQAWRASLRAATVAVQAAKAAKLAAVFTQRAEQSCEGAVADATWVGDRHKYGKAMTGPGVTTQERLLEEVVALSEVSLARYGNFGPEELRRITTVMKGKVEKRKAEQQEKEEDSKPANHNKVRLFWVRSEAQRDKDEDCESKHSFGQSAGSSVFGQGVRGSLATENADGGILRRDSCGQRVKDDTGKLFKNDGGEDFETRSCKNSDDGEGKCTTKSGGENFHSGKGFGNVGGVLVLGLRRPHRPGRRRWAH